MPALVWDNIFAFACEELHLMGCRHPIQVIKAKYRLGDCSHMITD